MALDVHLKRMGNSTWEFRLIGKKGFNISVTEAQVPERRRSKIPVQEEVEYSSPSTESSDEESQPSQGVNSGLYDPVLDDTEVIYETIGPADSDQPSNQLEQPTEVQFEVQQFTEQPEITRSLASSPFLISTKPYRPFSTEPLEIPPIEDPIILNPQYHDVFPGYEIEEQPPATKFKLPISEQYDPQLDPTKEIVLVTNKIYVVQSDDTEQSKQVFLSDQSTSEKLQVERKEYNKNIRKNEQKDYEYLEKMKKEIDLDKIEATALNIVDEIITIKEQTKSEINLDKIEETALNVVEESIQQAVTIAEDIDSEISMELKETVQKESHTETVLQETEHSEIKLHTAQKEESTTKSKIESSVHEQTSDLHKQTLSVKEGKEAKSVVNDFSETIDEVTDKIMQEEESVEMAVTESKYKHKEQTSEKEEKMTHKKITENKAVSSINSTPHRAYTIGLQTIPNIRGSVQSSYHHDLLLKTFFVHLTDVMVALSRFILTEPVSTVPSKDVDFVTKDKAKINKKSEKQIGSVQTLREQKVSKESKDIKNEETAAINAHKYSKIISNNISKNSKSAMVKDDQVLTSEKTNIIIENSNLDNSREYHIQEIVSDDVTRHELKVEDGEIVRNRKLSGAKIAQIEGMKPVDLTDKMNKVISEFQRKSGTEINTNEEYIEDHRRSRSKSRLGEEVIHENILLENVSQVDSKKKSVDIFEAKSEKRLTESGAIKYEGRESENSMLNENGKITYVAIVESHVYTNKDAIFEEQIRRMSESSKTATSFESTQHVSDTSSKSRDVNMSVINDVKDESLEKLSLARNIESSVQKSSVKVQNKSVSKVALQNTTDIMEQHKIIHEDQLIAAKSHISIERPVQIVADKTETFTEENIEVLEVPKPDTRSSKQVIEASAKTVAEIKEVILNDENAVTIDTPVPELVKPKCALDTTLKALADKTEIFTEENIEVLEVPEPVTRSSKQIIEASAKTVAEIKEVILNDENAVTIETPVPELVKPKCALDTTLKALAEKTEVLVGDNIKNIETITSPNPSRQAKVIVNESVAAVVTEISTLEPKDVVLEVPEIPMKQTQTIIQEPVFHIPETVEMCLVESKGEIEVPKVTTSKAKIQIEVAKVADQAMIITLEKADQQLDDKPFFVQKNANLVEEQSKLAQAEIQTVKVEEAKCEITDVTEIPKKYEEVDVQYTVELPKEDHVITYQEESAELKIVKEEVIEVTPPVEVYEDFDFSVRKVGVDNQISQSINIHEQSSQLEATKSSIIQSAAYEQSHAQSDKYMTKSEQLQLKQAIMQSQESKFTSSASSVSSVSQTALNQKDYQVQTHSVKDKLQNVDLNSAATSTSQSKSNEQRKLTLKTDLTETKLVKENGENGHSSPSTSVLPTPLVDEYVFKLEARLPRSRSTTPVPRDCSVTPPSEHEDPNIVKKKLVPQIVDTNIEQVIFDPPLPTPTSPGKKSPPKYVKPGLRGGSDRPEITKEEIMEIERKSSLLTSAIDETIRSIEEYKESVGIEMKEEIVEEQTITESSAEIVSEQNGEIIVANGYIEENEEEVIGSEDEQNKFTIEEMHNDDAEQSVEQSVVFNGRITNGTEYDESTNGELTKTVEIDFTEKKQEDVVETVTINLSKIKRDSLQDTNVGTTLEFNDNKENSILNGDINIDRNNLDSIQSAQMNEQIEYSNTTTDVIKKVEEKVIDPLQGYRPVEFNPEACKQRKQSEMQLSEQIMWETKKIEVYKTDSGEIIGSQQGIIDGLEEPIVDPEIAKELGKPGMPEDKIAELISGEAEMLREAHVMGLARVLKSHMHRTDDDSSVDFMKIKPSIESLKDSEVLKALNEEILRSREVKQKEERKWTTFLQKPTPKSKQKMVFCGNKEDALNYNFENLYLDDDTTDYGDEPYRVRIVKQPKPRVAPDFKPEDFDTGPLPWEQRAVIEEKEAVEAPPVEPEDPILIPEEVPEFVEAVDPLPESEVPDLEDTGIPLPPSPLPHEQQSLVLEEPQHQEEENIIEETEAEETLYQDAAENLEEMDNNKLSDQLMSNIESMVDPNATLEEQLAQMRAQLAALAQLPNVIQQTLELVTKQITQISHQKTVQTIERISESQEQFVDAVANFEATQTEQTTKTNEIVQNQVIPEIQEEIISEEEAQFKREEEARLNREEEERMIEEQKRLEQQKKELIEQMRIEQESRQVKQRSTPRVGKPRPMFGPPVPAERPVVLPGGRKWRKPEDAYNEQRINEALTAQAEVIKGKAIGVNFMKYEKPPVSLDHLQQSEVYKVVHNMDQTPLKRVELLTPVVAEADYRERARSATPCSDRMGNEQRFSMPQQLQP